MMFHVNSSGLSVFWSVEELKCFQHAFAVNVKTGGMFFENHTEW